jgi:hypothetical protein
MPLTDRSLYARNHNLSLQRQSTPRNLYKSTRPDPTMAHAAKHDPRSVERLSSAPTESEFDGCPN